VQHAPFRRHVLLVEGRTESYNGRAKGGSGVRTKRSGQEGEEVATGNLTLLRQEGAIAK
jgi:hypothetical protein